MKIKQTNFERQQERRIKKFLLEKYGKPKKKKKKKKKKTLKKARQHKTKEQYYKELKNTKWFKRRKQILELDDYLCRNCGSDQDLQVHHKTYIEGKKAWQYPDELLITLCNKCHKQIHGLA